MRLKARWLYVSALCALSLIMSPPLLASPKEELEQTQKDIEQAKQKQDKLSERTKKLEAELSALQQKLVQSAGIAQQAEADLSNAEEKLRILNEQLQDKSDELKSRQENLSQLVLAALRLSHTPPEAMVMMPGSINQTIKAARALKMASDSIRQETESLGLQMIELKKLKAKVAKHRDALASKQDALTKQQKNVEKQLDERKALQEKLGHQQQEEADKIARLAKKAEDLQSLVSSLEKEAEEKRKITSEEKKNKLQSFARAKGRIHPPVAGQVVRKFGASEGKNATSKGLTIETRDKAQVTSPYDGEVVFTGPFLGYGQLVIIRHSDDFHTLLAGLDKIDASVGEFLLEGEPIGAMGDDDSGNRLYVELRKNNQPVDPAPWISGLNKK